MGVVVHSRGIACVAEHFLQNLRFHPGFYGDCCEGVSAVVWRHAGYAERFHQLPEITLCKIWRLSVPIICVNEHGASLFPRCAKQASVSRQADRTHRDDAVTASLRLRSTDKIVFVTVRKRNGEQLVRSAAGGDEDKRDRRGDMLGRLYRCDLLIRKRLLFFSRSSLASYEYFH